MKNSVKDLRPQRAHEKKYYTFLSFMLAFLLAGYGVGFAEVDFETDQSKINTEDAGPVAPGDIEVGFTYNLAMAKRQYDNDADRRRRGYLREHAYDLAFATGIVDGIDIHFGIGYADLFDKDNGVPSHGHGWSDIEIGSKLQLYHSDERELTFTYFPSVVIPSGRESRSDRLGPGGDSTVFTQRLIVSKNWGRWNVNGDTAYGLLIGNRQGARGTWDINCACGYQVYSWLQPAVELNYAHDFVNSSSDADSFAITGGLIMPVHERVRVNAGVQQVLAGRNADQTTNITAAVTIFI
ncbi:MAG: transporter [Candidatus Omnitrophica bacterium]|nr:transporter [Candidatus Omnitrophota bacterium]